MRFFACDFSTTLKYLLVLTCINGCAMRIILSKHAEDKMVERGISQAEVKKAIAAGSTYSQTPDKFVAEYGYFSVVYKRTADACLVITVQLRC